MACKILSESEAERISKAVREAEKMAASQFVPVIVSASDPYPAATWRCAITISLLVNFFFIWRFPHIDPLWIVGLQSISLVFGYGIGKLRFCKRLFLNDYNVAQEVHQRAFEAFLEHNVHQTKNRSGVLIFVSLFERRALILSDIGIHQKVDDSIWESLLKDLLAGIRNGDLANALANTTMECGKIVAKYFPADGSESNELSDNVIVE